MKRKGISHFALYLVRVGISVLPVIQMIYYAFKKRES